MPIGWRGTVRTESLRYQLTRMGEVIAIHHPELGPALVDGQLSQSPAEELIALLTGDAGCFEDRCEPAAQQGVGSGVDSMHGGLVILQCSI